MTEFPKGLHDYHIFTVDGIKYIADLIEGVLIPIDEIDSDILECCERLSVDHIIERLRAKYSYAEIYKALDRMTKYVEIGLIFTSISDTEGEADIENHTLKLFVTPGFLLHQPQTSFTINFSNYNLLTALAKQAEVYLAFPSIPKEEGLPEIDFSVDGIQKITYDSGRTFSPARHIPKGCDGIIALSPSSLDELVFLRYNDIPVIARVYSESMRREEFINPTLEKCAALRDYDALVADALWAKDFLNSYFADSDHLYTIPSGMDLGHFAPMDKRLAKQQLAEVLGDEEILRKPLVGIALGIKVDEGLRMVYELAMANPSMMFLVIDSLLEPYIQHGPGNVYGIAIRHTQDWDAMPIFFNALDTLFFTAVVGASSSLLLEAMACGVPSIIAGCGTMSQEAWKGGIFISIEADAFGNVSIPLEDVSNKLQQLLACPDEQTRLGEEAKQRILSYTWEQTATEIVGLFRKLNSKKRFMQKISQRHFPIVFSYSYSKAKNCIEPRAVQMPYLYEYSVEEGLSLSLTQDHTPAEIDILMRYLKSDYNK